MKNALCAIAWSAVTASLLPTPDILEKRSRASQLAVVTYKLSCQRQTITHWLNSPFEEHANTCILSECSLTESPQLDSHSSINKRCEWHPDYPLPETPSARSQHRELVFTPLMPSIGNLALPVLYARSHQRPMKARWQQATPVMGEHRPWTVQRARLMLQAHTRTQSVLGATPGRKMHNIHRMGEHLQQEHSYQATKRRESRCRY